MIARFNIILEIVSLRLCGETRFNIVTPRHTLGVIMSYTESIRRINTAEANYFRICDLADTDDTLAAALAILNEAKARHRELFGTLRRVDGEWI